MARNTAPKPTSLLVFEAWFVNDDELVSIKKPLPGHLSPEIAQTYFSEIAGCLPSGKTRTFPSLRAKSAESDMDDETNELLFMLTKDDASIVLPEGTARKFVEKTKQLGWSVVHFANKTGE